ncbi:MAG: type I-A CRISPR-associated protein Cas4/Csa1 [Thermocladium sp.]
MNEDILDSLPYFCMTLPRWVWDYIKSMMEGGSFAEVRGWFRDIVSPRHSSRPTVSEVTSPCPTKRDVYLRRVSKVAMPDSDVIRMGRLIHEVFLTPFRVELVFSRLDNYFESIMGSYGELAAKYRDALYELYRRAVALSLQAKEEGIPYSVEPTIPASSIGFSDFVRPDILLGFIPIEVVSSSLAWDDVNVGRKELAVTAYALAIESWIGHPVDIGIVLHISLNSEVKLTWRVAKIDDTLRRTILDARDYVARIIETGEDPGLSQSCPRTCPFYGVCHA